MTYKESRAEGVQDLDLARILLVDDNPAARLTMHAVLQASGYFVDAVSSAAEALAMMDRWQYALVVTDLSGETPEARLEVLAQAQLMTYQPATAILTSHASKSPDMAQRQTLVEPLDLPALLTQVAELISQRAARLVHERMKLAVQD